MKYTIGIDIGVCDETVAILMLFIGGRAYVLGEKGTGLSGKNKMTPLMKEKIKNANLAYEKGYINKKNLSNIVAEILMWDECNPIVYID